MSEVSTEHSSDQNHVTPIQTTHFQAGRIARIGVFTALIAVSSQLSIPMPAGVPMTLQTLVIPLAGILLGAMDGTIATLVYLLLGAIGLPVFAGFAGGVGVLFGMTGGFLLSFPVMAYFAGAWYHGKKVRTALGLIVGAVINYAVGTVLFVILTKSTFAYAFSVCVLPFLPTAILKIIIIFFLAPILKKALSKAGI